MKIVKDKVLVVAAHPDDELLGCGGTIALHVLKGDEVFIVIAAEGATSRFDEGIRKEFSEELLFLKKCSENAANLLGIKNLKMLGLPDNLLDSINRLDLNKLIEKEINSIKPTIIYTHHSGDVNVDHRRLHEAVITACRPKPGICVKRILSFETLSSTEWQPPGSGIIFQPNWFIDIEHVLDKKLEALKFYESEMFEWPHSRSIKSVKNLAKYRGSQVGKNAAEAFHLLRNIE